MNKKIIFLIASISLVMNGCVVDRIKQRVYAKKLKEYKLQQQKRLSAKDLKNIKVIETIERKPKVLYTPFKPVVEEPVRYKKVSTNNMKSHKKVSTNSKKSHKKTSHIVKKEYKEPYSIEQNENDPELLGPQTTLKSNPLFKAKGKIKDIKKI